MSRKQLEKSGYLKSFPNLLGCVCALHGSEASIRAAADRHESGGDWTDVAVAPRTWCSRRPPATRSIRSPPRAARCPPAGCSSTSRPTCSATSPRAASTACSRSACASSCASARRRKSSSFASTGWRARRRIAGRSGAAAHARGRERPLLRPGRPDHGGQPAPAGAQVRAADSLPAGGDADRLHELQLPPRSLRQGLEHARSARRARAYQLRRLRHRPAGRSPCSRIHGLDLRPLAGGRRAGRSRSEPGRGPRRHAARSARQAIPGCAWRRAIRRARAASASRSAARGSPSSCSSAVPAPHGVDERRALDPGPGGPLADPHLHVPTRRPPARALLAPGLIYFHGGGLVAGRIDTHDSIARALRHCGGLPDRLGRVPAGARTSLPGRPRGCRSPPSALHRRRTRRDFGIDAARLGVCGDSAGATLVAAACQRSPRARGATPRAAVAALPDSRLQPPRRARGASSPRAISSIRTRSITTSSTTCPRAPTRTDPRISPLRAADLAGVPPTIIHTAEFDPLRDEGRDYFERLTPWDRRCPILATRV